MSTLSVGSTSIWKLDPLSVFTETFISPRCRRRRRLRRTGGLEADSSGQAEERRKARGELSSEISIPVPSGRALFAGWVL
jgi:hypothetical protein